jgi:hypothetical protein
MYESIRNFDLYFLTVLPEGEESPAPGTPESEQYLWSLKGTVLELTHNYGSETDDTFQVYIYIYTYIHTFIHIRIIYWSIVAFSINQI